MSDEHDESTEAAPKAPRKTRRRRHDPVDVPILGDYTKDQVLNKDPSRAYALVSTDDMAVMVGRGFTRTKRVEDGSGARPAFDLGGDGDYTVNGQLVLMDAPIELAEAHQRASEKRFNDRAKSLRMSIQNHVAANPGSTFSRAAG
jgi:hypothetical protein